ncbi:hypothetical protein OB905_10725 [Halobacteria archaeon AArc-dxtr1]|nr:hypothetical protein [Halobacteria archaeon AArc-dxtr1]
MLDRARAESATVCLLRRSGERARTALERSRLATTVGGAWRRLTGASDRAGDTEAGEADASSASSQRARMRDVGSASKVGGVLAAGGAIAGRVGATADGARLVAAGLAVRWWAFGSRAYRWLTREPDPEVIVIDLRETRTVGPVLSLVDRTVAAVTASAPASRLGEAGAAFAATVRARPIRVVGLIGITAAVSVLLLAIAAGSLTQSVVVGSLSLVGLSALGLRSRRTLTGVRSSRTFRAVEAAFKPPALPEREPADARNGSPTETESDSERETT